MIARWEPFLGCRSLKLQANGDETTTEGAAMTNVQMWILLWQKAIVYKQA